MNRMKQTSRKRKQMAKKFQQQKISGSFARNHHALKVRSIRNLLGGDIRDIVANMRKSREKAEYEKMHEIDECFESETNQQQGGHIYPFQDVHCTIEWQNVHITEKKTTKVEDSKVSYEEVRRKEPKLLCDFFERHLHFVN